MAIKNCAFHANENARNSSDVDIHESQKSNKRHGNLTKDRLFNDSNKESLKKHGLIPSTNYSWLVLCFLLLAYNQDAEKTCLCYDLPEHSHHHRVHRPSNTHMRSLGVVTNLHPHVTPHPSSFVGDHNSSAQEQFSSWASMLTSTMAGSHDKLDLHIRNILVPRVSGTSGNKAVRQYIIDSLESNDYQVQLDEFTDTTPYGQIDFANIIAYSNPNACRQLVLACHYDSKLMEGFLGATDSAVPCAMLLKLSETFSKSFRPSDTDNPNNSLGLTFLFFDGEEAFVEWGPTDSLYGSRHLAEKWQNQPAPKQCNKKNELARIELLVVLDLIGASDTSFIMYSKPLKHHYEAMQRSERAHLANKGLTSSQIKREAAFRNGYIPLDFVQDDHVPFHKRGVPCLSLLAHPFPKVWHEVTDNYNAIDFARTKRIHHVLEEFVANYKK